MMMGIKMQGKNGLFTRLHTATFINYQLFRCLMTKEHGLVGMCQRLDQSQIKHIYDMSKSFAESVGKGEIQAKHGSEETKKLLQITNSILGSGRLSESGNAHFILYDRKI